MQESVAPIGVYAFAAVCDSKPTTQYPKHKGRAFHEHQYADTVIRVRPPIFAKVSPVECCTRPMAPCRSLGRDSLDDATAGRRMTRRPVATPFRVA